MNLYAKLSACAALALAMIAPAQAEKLTIAAAADLKYAMADVVEQFRATRPDDQIEVIYGSSGKFFTQIKNGAPFDMYFSADIEYPRTLEKEGLASGATQPYAIGRIVLWSLKPELAKTPLKALPQAAIRKFAIANPQHAPYGLRAKEAMEHQGVWAAMEPKLVMGENIAHTAQFIDTGAAEAGVVALALVLSPTMDGKGAWSLIPSEWHEPLEQGYVITRRAAGNALAQAFSEYMASEPARVVMRRYGFVLPGEEGR
ncbi:MAG: molybdate ABC transporter substrate-binding protein [Thiohalomonadaceae bacterium]